MCPAGAQIRIVIKAECRRLSVFVRDNLRTGLVHTDALDLFGNAEPLKQRQIERQQRFADVKPRKAILFEQD